MGEKSIGLWQKVFPVFEVDGLSDSDAMLLLVKLLGRSRMQIASHWRKFYEKVMLEKEKTRKSGG